MAFSVYIIQSQGNGRYDVGQAEDTLERLRLHNRGDVKSTKAGRPWILRRVFRPEVRPSSGKGKSNPGKRERSSSR